LCFQSHVTRLCRLHAFPVYTPLQKISCGLLLFTVGFQKPR
jgi:hypothetical protein